MADDAIRVFNRSLFPRMVLVAEIYLDMQHPLQRFVPFEQKIVVGRHGFHFRKSFFDADERPVDVGNRDTKDLFDERSTAFAVGDREEDALAAFAGNDEISFGIPNVPSFVDVPWPLVDEGSLGERLFTPTFP